MECFENNKDIKKHSRRSKILKNLEQEVELILSQEESDDDIIVEDAVIEILPRTPSRNVKAKEISTPRASQAVLQDMLQTPRRSCRKSIKPTQEYDDIVSKSCSRSNRTMNKNLLITEEEENEEDPAPIAQPKWTPAKVGRVSQKRSRKSRRNTKAKQKQIKAKKINEEHEICSEMGDDVKLDETENLVNINTENEDSIVLVQPLENIKFEEKFKNVMETVVSNKHLNFIENPRESLNEFMEIEKQINNLQVHDVPIHPVQEDADNDMSNEETNDVSIHLIQEDSEDVKELPNEENIPKIENNCENLVEENKNNSIKNVHLEDSFGCYLKSKEINISELGLNILKDDDQDFDEKQKIKEEEIHSNVATNELEEMPSLILCDDEEEEVAIEVKLNETFEADDSVFIIETTSKPSQDVMESLKMSDDEGDTPKKAPRIMLTTTELNNETLLATPFKTSTLKPSTPKQLVSPRLTTPKQSAKAFRFPTPYRNRRDLKFNKSEDCVQKNEIKNIMNYSWMSSVTSLEPKDIVLRGIRKRSLSVCLDGKKGIRPKPLASSVAKDRMVSFYSPANQTTIIDDLDMVIAKSLKKQKKDDTKESSNKFVTTRRKRSMSVDESLMSSSMLMSRLPRPVPIQNTPSKSQTLISSSSKPLTRTKLPNFAAIHNKNFQKMENLVDHVNRKQERSKILINSNTKIKPASAQKNISLFKFGNNNIEKPKALKKIDLGVSATKIPSNTTLTTSTDTIKNQDNLTKTRTLPHPHTGSIKKVIKTGIIPQRIPHNYNNQKAEPSAPQQQQIRKYLKPSQNSNTINRIPVASTSTILKHKSNFNLSTSILKPNSTSSSMENLNKIQATTTSNNDKMASRLQRHMDLFKGRVPATRAGVASRKNDVVIRGVRSNRRFELQMQHRKNMEN